MKKQIEEFLKRKENSVNKYRIIFLWQCKETNRIIEPYTWICHREFYFKKYSTAMYIFNNLLLSSKNKEHKEYNKRFDNFNKEFHRTRLTFFSGLEKKQSINKMIYLLKLIKKSQIKFEKSYTIDLKEEIQNIYDIKEYEEYHNIKCSYFKCRLYLIKENIV